MEVRLSPEERGCAYDDEVTSSAFQAGQAIPTKYTCEGADISPPLQWSGVPAGAKSLALICDDPDAPVGTWVHWVLYDLPVTATDLVEKVPASETLSLGAKQGINDFKRVGYGGPCPPPGKPHRYSRLFQGHPSLLVGGRLSRSKRHKFELAPSDVWPMLR
jgi:Raf kinase inhibitor-like YbhB/YbcL family protein